MKGLKQRRLDFIFSSSYPEQLTFILTCTLSVAMRLLTLHASALNDAEYDLYTTSLRDLVDSEDDPNDNVTFDDAHYERFKITVREARAWLRGRYNDMPVHEIDSILKTIAPSHEGLTGGQFFAVMRLVMHARNGKEVDGSLVFEQGKSSSCCLDRLLACHLAVCIAHQRFSP